MVSPQRSAGCAGDTPVSSSRTSRRPFAQLFSPRNIADFEEFTKKSLSTSGFSLPRSASKGFTDVTTICSPSALWDHHNDSQGDFENIKVCCRVRPPLVGCYDTGDVTACVYTDPVAADRKLWLAAGAPSAAVTATPSKVSAAARNQPTAFDFDHVFDPTSKQQTIFRVVGRPIVHNVLSGLNACILAYGATSSGKTHTMLGNVSESGKALSEQAGLAPRMFQELFDQIKRQQDAGRLTGFECKCSVTEIYNEAVSDLLDPGRGNLLVHDTGRGVMIDCLTRVTATSAEEALALLQRGLAARQTGATRANVDSSRSHCIFGCQLELHVIEKGSLQTLQSTLNLVDLAGSERQKEAESSGARFKEAQKINGSLSALGRVMKALTEAGGAQPHIPYRDSKLTHILRDFLGGNAKCVVMATVSGAPADAHHTYHTLTFARRAKHVVNTVRVNEASGSDRADLAHQVALLHKQLQNQSDIIQELSFRTSAAGALEEAQAEKEAFAAEASQVEARLRDLQRQHEDVRRREESARSHAGDILSQHMTTCNQLRAANSVADELRRRVEEGEAASRAALDAQRIANDEALLQLTCRVHAVEKGHAEVAAQEQEARTQAAELQRQLASRVAELAVSKQLLDAERQQLRHSKFELAECAEHTTEHASTVKSLQLALEEARADAKKQQELAASDRARLEDVISAKFDVDGGVEGPECSKEDLRRQVAALKAALEQVKASAEVVAGRLDSSQASKASYEAQLAEAADTRRRTRTAVKSMLHDLTQQRNAMAAQLAEQSVQLAEQQDKIVRYEDQFIRQDQREARKCEEAAAAESRCAAAESKVATLSAAAEGLRNELKAQQSTATDDEAAHHRILAALRDDLSFWQKRATDAEARKNAATSSATGSGERASFLTASREDTTAACTAKRAVDAPRDVAQHQLSTRVSSEASLRMEAESRAAALALMQQKLQEAEAAAEGTSAELASSKQQCGRLQQEAEQGEQQRRELASKAFQAVERIQELLAQRQEREKERSLLQSRLHAAEQLVTALEQRLTETQAQCDAMTDERQAAESVHGEQLQQHRRAAEVAASAAADTLEQHTALLARLRKTETALEQQKTSAIKDQTAAKELREAHSAKIKELNNKVVGAERAAEVSAERVEELTSQTATLETMVIDAEQHIKAADAELADKHAELKALAQQLIDVRASGANSVTEASRLLRDSTSQLQAERKEAAAAEQDYEKRLAAATQKLLEQQAAQQAQQEEAKAAAARTARKARDDVRAARQEARAAEEKLAATSAAQSATEASAEALQRQLTDMAAEVAAARGPMEAAEKLKQQLDAKEAGILAAEGRLATLHAQLASQTNDSEGLRQQLAAASGREATLQQSVSEADERAASLARTAENAAQAVAVAQEQAAAAKSAQSQAEDDGMAVMQQLEDADAALQAAGSRHEAERARFEALQLQLRGQLQAAHKEHAKKTEALQAEAKAAHEARAALEARSASATESAAAERAAVVEQELQQVQLALQQSEEEAQRQHRRTQQELSDVAAAQQRAEKQLEKAREGEAMARAAAETHSREAAEAAADVRRLEGRLATAREESSQEHAQQLQAAREAAAAAEQEVVVQKRSRAAAEAAKEAAELVASEARAAAARVESAAQQQMEAELADLNRQRTELQQLAASNQERASQLDAREDDLRSSAKSLQESGRLPRDLAAAHAELADVRLAVSKELASWTALKRLQQGPLGSGAATMQERGTSLQGSAMST